MANESLQDLGNATQGGNTPSLSSAAGTSSSGANVQMSDFFSGSSPVGSLSGPTSVDVGDLENYSVSVSGSGSRYGRISDNGNNFDWSVSGPANIFNTSTNLIAVDFTGDGTVTVSVTYTDVYNGINETRTRNITVASAVDVSVSPTSIFFGTKDPNAIPEQQQFMIFNNASSSVTVDVTITGDPDGAFNVNDHTAPVTISGNSSITRTVEFPATSFLSDGIYGGTVSITVDGTQEAFVTLSGTIESGGGGGGFPGGEIKE